MPQSTRKPHFIYEAFLPLLTFIKLKVQAHSKLYLLNEKYISIPENNKLLFYIQLIYKDDKNEPKWLQISEIMICFWF